MKTAPSLPINHLDEKVSKWFAVYTKYKREKLVKGLLEQKGINVYLPLLKFTRRYTRKVREVELPLISCYIFVKITKPEYVPVLETENVMGFVKFSKNLIAIPEEEMEIMKRVVGEGVEVEVDHNIYNEGDEVEIIAGNLTGLKGRLIARHGKKEFLVELTNLGYSLRMNVAPSLLRKV